MWGVALVQREERRVDVELAILADPGLTERQKHSLLDVYASFLALNNHPEQHPDQPE